MAYEPIIEDNPQPEAPKEPDPLDRVADQIREMNERINQAYQHNKGIQQPPPAQPVQYVPYPVQQEEEPQLTEADILADLPGTISTLADQIASQREQALREEFGSHLSRVYEKDFDRDFDALKSQPHFKFVEAELKDWAEKNPQEKFTPGRLMEKYNSLAYSKLPEIQEAERAEAEANEPARVRAVDHSIPVSTSPAPPPQSADEVSISEEEETMRQKWNRQQGLNMSKKEWAAWRDGELGPSDDYDED